ncbi:hypothetical protein [Streptomyces sp. NBC_00658]|uniref:hypothetical protein n=1 Tax=Streptomyces sp. NBC_00658 TaxID=2975800 RepID=UPI003244B8B5
MPDDPPPWRCTAMQRTPEKVEAVVAQLPGSNAIAAVLIAVSALLSAIAVLILMPGQVEALGTAATIVASGFALSAKIAIPRR